MRAAAAAALLALSLVSAAAAQNAPAAPAAPETGAPLPLDPAIRSATLPNGLTYFIRRNARPEGRVLLRLAVKAGSVDEDDDQRGLAHVLEHMAFNGSAHFKPGELVGYLQSIGARFGPHVNAYTSYDETVYMLDVPTARDGALARGFEALGDFAGGLTLDTAEIDRERGVVIEEWRGRLGAATRMQQPQIAALFGDSRYTERLPIGTPDSLRTFKPARLRDFYRRHYRPDRMAVVVVGDIQPDAAEALVKQHFGALRAAGGGARAVHPIPPQSQTRYVSVSDPEAQGSSVTVMIKHPLQQLRTATDYRRSLVRSLVHQMLGSRFAEMARQPDAPFLGAGSSQDTLGRTVEAFSISARVKDGGIEQGLQAIAREIARVRQFGFGDAELERARRATLATYERAYNERNNSESAPLAAEIVRYYLNGEAAPGIETELQLARRFLPTITAEDTGALARALLTDANRVVLASAPDKAGVPKVAEAALAGALATGLSATVTAWRDETEGRDLMAQPPRGGTVTAKRTIAELGVTVLTLSNGVEVWLKPTDFRSDQVLFTGYAKGGLSLAGESEYRNASLASSLVGIAGVGGLNPIDLDKLLAGRIASAAPSINSFTHGVSGSSTPKDLEVALQLAYLAFTAPNEDPAAFELMKRRLEASLANQAQSPGAAFVEQVRKVNTGNHYSARPLKLEDLPSLDPAKMMAFYRARFANAADFTFFFVGSFAVDDVTPLIATYLGGLPSTGARTAAIGDLRLQFPASVQRETVTKGREPRSQTVVSFFADTRNDELEAHRARAASAVLENRLRDILREQLGGTYSVGVSYSDTLPQTGYGTISVQFGSAPENVDTLTAAVMTEIERLRRDGPTTADLQAVKEAEKNDIQASLKQNGFWLNSLQTAHLLGRDPLRILQRIARAESLTVDNVHAALRAYLPADRYTVVSLRPEGAGASLRPAGAGASLRPAGAGALLRPEGAVAAR